jgi:hypothetical protein
MDKTFRMRLKPLVNPNLTIPFTEVNGNKTNSSSVLLPSALADGLHKLLLILALATFVISCVYNLLFYSGNTCYRGLFIS